MNERTSMDFVVMHPLDADDAVLADTLLREKGLRT